MRIVVTAKKSSKKKAQPQDAGQAGAAGQAAGAEGGEGAAKKRKAPGAGSG